MLRYILEIKLLSDMCCGAGEGDGIRQDVSSTYDKNGFPIIYGRRLKGLLRDKVEFMQKNGYISSDMVEKIFGSGYIAGILRVGNAVLSDVDELKAELRGLNDEQKKLINPAAIEEIYTTDRHSTAIEDGVAKKHSLRIVGTFPKGLIFNAVLEINCGKESQEFSIIENAVKLLRNMGLGRNRGYGEVVCTLSEYSKYEEYKDICVPDEDIDTLSYIIKNEDNIILKKPYISGTVLQGYFAGCIANTDYGIKVDEFLENVMFSMAYPTDVKDEESYPMPLGMMSQKGKPELMLSFADGYNIQNGVQYVRNSGYYRELENKNISKITADTVINYHFLKKQKLLYTVKCVSEGHYFLGHIHAPKKYIKILTDIINVNKGIFHLGAAINAEHGKCRISIKSFGKKDVVEKNSSTNKVIFELLSDTIIVDDFACNTGDIAALKAEVSKILNCNIDDIKEIYTDTLEIAGYNSKWGMPRLSYTAFSMGTQLVIETEKAKLSEGFIGILNNEGYGKYRVRDVQIDGSEFLAAGENNTEEKSQNTTIKENGLVYKVLRENIIKEAENAAIKSAEDYLKNNKNITSSNAMRLNVAYKACEMDDKIYTKFNEYRKANFKGQSNMVIFEFAENVNKSFEKFMDGNSYKDILDNCVDMIFKAYIRKYIFATKMYFREMEAV